MSKILIKLWLGCKLYSLVNGGIKCIIIPIIKIGIIVGIIKSKKDTIAIEVSSTSIRMLLLSGNDKKIVVKAYSSLPLPKDLLLKDNFFEEEEFKGIVLKALKLIKVKAKSFSIYMNEIDTFETTLEFDEAMDDYEVELKINFDINKIVPFAKTEAVAFDFDPIDSSNGKKSVLLSACKKDKMDSFIASIENKTLKCNSVDMQVYCLERGFEKFVVPTLPSSDKDDIISLIDIGESGLRVSIVRGYRIIYSREYGSGGSDLTHSIVQNYGLSVSEAVKYKKNLGKVDSDFIDEIIDPFYKKILNNVNNSLQNFFSATEYSDVHYVVLMGGGANLLGLKERFEDRFDAGVYVANPVSNVNISKNIDRDKIIEESSSLVALFGLAVKGLV